MDDPRDYVRPDAYRMLSDRREQHRQSFWRSILKDMVEVQQVVPTHFDKRSNTAAVIDRCFIAFFVLQAKGSGPPSPPGRKRKFVLFRVCCFILLSVQIPITP